MHVLMQAATDVLPEEKVAKAYMLTQGNAREYRRIAALLDLEGLQTATA